MIAAVDAPCVCLNVAVQRIGPLSGADEVDAEVDADDAHPAVATMPTSIAVRDPRIQFSA
jgi:hypothetical protein